MDGKDPVKYHRIFFRVSRRVFDATAAKIEIRKKNPFKEKFFLFLFQAGDKNEKGEGFDFFSFQSLRSSLKRDALSLAQ